MTAATTASVIETMSSSSFSNSNTSLGYSSEPSIANNKIELNNGKTIFEFSYFAFFCITRNFLAKILARINFLNYTLKSP
jgi:hypothetical protein